MQNTFTNKKKQLSSNSNLGVNQKRKVSTVLPRIPFTSSKSTITSKDATPKGVQNSLGKRMFKTSSVISPGPKPGPNSVQEGSRLGELIDTGLAVGKTVAGLVAGDPMSLLTIPNTLLKVVDTAKNVIRDINSSDAKQKVVVPSGSDVKESGNQIILDKLKTVQPVLTVTQLPSSNGIEVSLPSLRSVVSTTMDAQGFFPETIYASFAGGVVTSSAIVGLGRWEQNNRVLPRDANRFGLRVGNHYAQIYQQYRLKRLTVQWVPRVGYNYKGNIAMNFMLGIDSNSVALPIGYQTISERSLKELKSVNSPFSLTFVGDKEWRYTGLPDSTSPDSMRSFCQCVFGIYHWGNESINEILGFPVYDFELEFRSNSESAWSIQSKISRSVGDAYIVASPNIEYRSYLKGLWYLYRIMKKNEEDFPNGINSSVLHDLLDTNPEYIEWVRGYIKHPSPMVPCDIASQACFDLLKSYDFLDERDVHSYDVYNFADEIEMKELVIGILSDAASRVFGAVLSIALETVISYQPSYDLKRLDPVIIGISAINLALRLIIANLENIYMKNFFGDMIQMSKDKVRQMEIRSGYLNDSFKLFLNMNQREILNGQEIALTKHIQNIQDRETKWLDEISYELV